MKGKIKKASNALLRDDYALSVKHLLDYLYDELDSPAGLPKGFTGATITDLLNMLITAKELKVQEMASLDEWIEEFPKEEE